MSTFRNSACDLFYGRGQWPNFSADRGHYLEQLAATLAALSAFLGHRPWLAGDSLSFPDFHLYEMLDQHLLLDPVCLDNFLNLVSFHHRFVVWILYLCTIRAKYQYFLSGEDS